MLLEAWRDYEDAYGNDSSRAAVENLMPKRVKKRRRIQTQDRSDAGWEEFFDYIFPEDEASKPNLKLLAMAKAWKKGVDVSVPVPGPPPTEPARVANEKNGSENIEDHDQEETAGDVSMSDDQAKEKPAADEDVPDDRDYSSDSSSSSGSESGDD